MRLKLPALSSLRAFDAASRAMNFTRAADELGMTQAAVSWQIRQLEERLGVRLFARDGSRLALTASGARLAQRTQRAFDQLYEGLQELQEATTLRISATQTLADWLVNRLPAFRNQHPTVLISLESTPQLRDLRGADAADLALRGGRGGWAGVEATKLIPALHTPMLSPALLARAGPLNEPSDLLNYELFRDEECWVPWFRAAGMAGCEPRYVPTDYFTQSHLATAAMAGQGVALLNPILFRCELSDGRLIRPFDITIESDMAYWFVHAPERRNEPAIVALRAFLEAEIAGANGSAAAA
ncbi:MAG: LysR family transcriptional regulator [Rhodospirillales bacterium]|nr:LysR family transcriptional regulator [Rhodospirillales bacterium]